MSSPAAPSTCHLLHLPDELFVQCIPDYVPPGACRKLFNVRGSRRKLLLYVQQDKDGGDERARKTLQRMAKSFPALNKVAVHVCKEVHSYAADSLFTPPPACGPAWLMNLTDITLAHGSPSPFIAVAAPHFDNFIPACIAKACPQLERLVLERIHCKQQPAGKGQGQDQGQGQGQQHQTQLSEGQGLDQMHGQPQEQGKGEAEGQQQQWQPVCLPQLKELALTHCTIDMDTEAIQQQLQALHSLTEFKLVTDGADGCDRFSSKVCDMEWEVDGADFAALEGPWPKLRRLDAWNADVTDADIWAIMESMPNLEELALGDINMTTSRTKRLPHLSSLTLCSPSYSWWSLLSLKDLLLSCARTPQVIARPPDYQLVAIDLSDCCDHNTAEEDIEAAASLVSVLQNAGGMHYAHHGPAALFFLSLHQPPHAQQVLHTLVFMFHELNCLVLEGSVHINTELLTAVGQLPNLASLYIKDYRPGMSIVGGGMERDRCRFDTSIWCGDMIALLPQVSCLGLRCGAATETRVICLCVTAPRAIKVQVEPMGWRDGELVQTVLAATQGRIAELEIVQPS